MTVATRIEHVTAPDGGVFDAHAFTPVGSGGRTSVPGVLLLQEIFGVGEFLKSKARLLAELGYAVLCPDVFWRLERNVELGHDEEALRAGLELSGRFSEVPREVTAGDLVAALGHLRAMPEVNGADEAGKVAVVGYCLGGRLAYEVAAFGEPDACVSYYGSGIAAELDLAARVTCPVLFHFGGSDPYIPRADVDKVATAFSDRPDAELVLQEQAGHAFENSFVPAFSNPEAAAASWPVTVEFLARTLRR